MLQHKPGILWALDLLNLLSLKIKSLKLNTLLVFYSCDLSVLVYDMVGHVQGRGVRGVSGDLVHLVHGRINGVVKDQSHGLSVRS